jgi:DNA-binding NarL/FixJ family response regulator
MTATVNQQENRPFIPKRPKLPSLKLTERELEVVYFVAKDYTDAQIADELCLHIRTVKTFIYYAKNKLCVRGRVGLAAWYFRSYGFPSI